MKETKLLDELYPEINNKPEIKDLIDQRTSSELTHHAILNAKKELTNPEALIIPETHQNDVRNQDRFVEYIERDVEKGVIGRIQGMTAAVSNNHENAYVIEDIENTENATKIQLI